MTPGAFLSLNPWCERPSPYQMEPKAFSKTHFPPRFCDVTSIAVLWRQDVLGPNLSCVTLDVFLNLSEPQFPHFIYLTNTSVAPDTSLSIVLTVVQK